MADTPDDDEASADRATAAMQAQLRKDVAAWSAERSGATSRQADEFAVPVTKPPVRKARSTAAASPPKNVAAAGPKPPFRMSYDGATEASAARGKVARSTR